MSLSSFACFGHMHTLQNWNVPCCGRAFIIHSKTHAGKTLPCLVCLGLTLINHSIWMKMLCKYLSTPVEKNIWVHRFKLLNSIPFSLFRIKLIHTLPLFYFLVLCCHLWLMTMCQLKMRQGLYPNQGLVFAFCTIALGGLFNYYEVLKKLSLLPVIWLWKLLPDCHNTEAVNDMNINVSAAHHRFSYHPNMGKATAKSICSLEDGMSKRNFKSKQTFPHTSKRLIFHFNCHL